MSKSDGPIVVVDFVVKGLRVIVQCIDCGYQVEPDPAEMAVCCVRAGGCGLVPAASMQAVAVAGCRLCRY
jgi:hypothetical protein